MKVWLAIEQDWESQNTLGVYDSKDGALRRCDEVAAAWLARWEGDTPYGYRIEGPYEVTVDLGTQTVYPVPK